MKTKFLLCLVLISSSIFLTGCFNVDGDFKSIRNITLKECGKNFATDTEFSLGSFELWLAEGIAGMADTDDMALEMIDNISGVQIGVYKRKDQNSIPTRNLFNKIDKKLNKKGLHYIVKSYGRNKMEAVYINDNEDKIFNELFVIKLDDKEVAIVQVTGDLEKVIETAIREEGFNIGSDSNSIVQR